METMLLTPLFAITAALALAGAVLAQRRNRRTLDAASKALRPSRVRVPRRTER